MLTTFESYYPCISAIITNSTCDNDSSQNVGFGSNNRHWWAVYAHMMRCAARRRKYQRALEISPEATHQHKAKIKLNFPENVTLEYFRLMVADGSMERIKCPWAQCTVHNSTTPRSMTTMTRSLCFSKIINIVCYQNIKDQLLTNFENSENVSKTRTERLKR